MRHKGRAVCNYTGGLQLASVIRQFCRRTGPGEESTLKTQIHGKTRTHTRTDSIEQTVHCCPTNPTLSTSTTMMVLPRGLARSHSLLYVLFVEVVFVLWRNCVRCGQWEKAFLSGSSFKLCGEKNILSLTSRSKCFGFICPVLEVSVSEVSRSTSMQFR